ncbi:MAG: aldo/keto reductase [Rhizobiaceae bacterium]|nr:MAG: aldo/keto reductase [Rhizobiaceae bacterium]
MDYRELGTGQKISRVVRGGWQLAGGHGAVSPEEAIEDMTAFADAGITTFDCADIYTGVEELIGAFRAAYADRRGSEALSRIRVHTKFVPDLSQLKTITRPMVEAAIDRSLRRLGVERLDLIQFHWWDYAKPRWLDVAGWLADLRKAGKIANIGGTNFDTPRVIAMMEAGVPLVSMQLQYSLLDARPEKTMAAVARERGISFLCYGTVAGGFLGERWLGRPEPQEALENRSLTKYKLIIDEFGGWETFQALLAVLHRIAMRHGSDIATVASRAILDRKGVAAVIVGARNGAHLASNCAIPDLEMTDADRAEIAAATGAAALLPGDVYTLERDRTSRHGSIMKYELNAGT